MSMSTWGFTMPSAARLTLIIMIIIIVLVKHLERWCTLLPQENKLGY